MKPSYSALPVGSDTIRTQIVLESTGQTVMEHRLTNGMGNTVPFLLPAMHPGAVVTVEVEGQEVRFAVDHCELVLRQREGILLKIMVVLATFKDK